MADDPSPLKLSMRPKLTRIRIDELRDHGEDFKTGWQKRKEVARGSVVSLFKAARSTVRTPERHSIEEESLGPRPVSRRVKAPAKSSVPVLDISDDVLDRLTSEPSTSARRPTSKFLSNQRQRAGIPEPERTKTPPPTQAELDRRPLDAEDIIYMFAGAPYFNVEDDAGHRQPKVVHGFAPTASDIRNAMDHAPFKHKSFKARTIDPRAEQATNKPVRHTVREIPSMLSAEGKDPGTIGFTHFLELPLRSEQYMDDAAVQHQDLLVTDPEILGLREFDIDNIADRLSELSKVYEMLRDGKGEATEWDQYMIEDIGEDLFSTLLSTDVGTTPAGTGSVSLPNQVSALQKVLSTQQVWFDFTNENWRAQLGQLMWQPRTIAKSLNGHLVNERDILLLQIALSAELAVRLEIAQRLTASEASLPGIYQAADLEQILNDQTDKIDWDMIVFRRFVECFEVKTRPQGVAVPLRRMSVAPNQEDEADVTSVRSQEPDVVFQLRKEHEQLSGLRLFTSSLDWRVADSPKAQQTLPKFDSFLTAPVEQHTDSFASEYNTPLTSPAPSPPPTEGTPALVLVRSESKLLAHSAFDESSPMYNAENNHSLSWLSKTWLSGFFLPGAIINQFLLHALLETNAGTKKLLPEAANSNDGFVHMRQMYWSKESVIARVLAPASDAKECSGWVSLPFAPQGHGDGWVQVLTQEPLYNSMEPRIYASDLVSRISDPLHCQDASKLQAGDFTTIMDGPVIPSNEAQFEGIVLNQSHVMQHTADGFLIPKTAHLTFKSPRNPKMPALTLPLTHSVHFVSSYPCYPDTRPRTSTASPTLESSHPIDSGRSTPLEKDLPLPPAHPLHVDYTYTIIPAAAILSSALPRAKDSDSMILMDSADDENPSTYSIQDEEVVVLDCRGSADLEVLARAWCAKVGENAIIGKGGRTCLACCIREAIGLGIGVVIRT